MFPRPQCSVSTVQQKQGPPHISSLIACHHVALYSSTCSLSCSDFCCSYCMSCSSDSSFVVSADSSLEQLFFVEEFLTVIWNTNTTCPFLAFAGTSTWSTTLVECMCHHPDRLSCCHHRILLFVVVGFDIDCLVAREEVDHYA